MSGGFVYFDNKDYFSLLYSENFDVGRLVVFTFVVFFDGHFIFFLFINELFPTSSTKRKATNGLNITVSVDQSRMYSSTPCPGKKQATSVLDMTLTNLGKSITGTARHS